MHQRKNTNGHNSSRNNSNEMYTRAHGGDVEGGGGRFNDTNSNILEQQNNDRISELSEQVARLKVRSQVKWRRGNKIGGFDSINDTNELFFYYCIFIENYVLKLPNLITTLQYTLLAFFFILFVEGSDS